MSLVQAKARYLEHKLRAIKATNETFQSAITTPFKVDRWTTRVPESIAAQWEPHRHSDTSWDWETIVRRYRDPDAFPFAGWAGGDRLAFIGLALTNSKDATTQKIWRREDIPAFVAQLLPRVKKLEWAHQTMTFPPNPSGLCIKYCKVVSCPFHGKGSPR